MAETDDELAAKAEVSAWREKHNDRAEARRRSQVDTAKLVVTFSLAVAATLVATALQVRPVQSLDVLAVSLLGVAFLATIAVIALDRIKEPEISELDVQAATEGWGERQRMNAFKTAVTMQNKFNDRVVRWLTGSTIGAVVLILASAVVAAVSLIIKKP